MKHKIKLLVLDVDGTLTDGKIYMGNDGELFKSFDIKDGCGIHDILPTIDVDWDQLNRKEYPTLHKGIIPVIITARESNIVLNRCKELNIEHIYQGCRNKANKLDEVAEMFEIQQNKDGKYEEIAYMGDDIIDLPIMKKCGFIACPADAVKAVIERSDFVATRNGGNGAVRELIEYLAAE